MPAGSSGKAHKKYGKPAAPNATLPVAGGSNRDTNLLSLVSGFLPNLKRAQRSVAELLLADPEQFITRSISECAKECGVSQGSVVAFCKLFGFKGFPAFKIRVAHDLARPVFVFSRDSRKGKQKSRSVLERAFNEHIKCLQ